MSCTQAVESIKHVLSTCLLDRLVCKSLLYTHSELNRDLYIPLSVSHSPICLTFCPNMSPTTQINYLVFDDILGQKNTTDHKSKFHR